MKQSFFVRRVRFQVKVDDTLASSRNDSTHATNQRQSLGPATAILDRVGLLGDFNFVSGKKLLRSRAGLSARAVVVPVQFGRHEHLQELYRG
jgi:hypothetical protein